MVRVTLTVISVNRVLVTGTNVILGNFLCMLQFTKQMTSCGGHSRTVWCAVCTAGHAVWLVYLSEGGLFNNEVSLKFSTQSVAFMWSQFSVILEMMSRLKQCPLFIIRNDGEIAKLISRKSHNCVFWQQETTQRCELTDFEIHRGEYRLVWWKR